MTKGYISEYAVMPQQTGVLLQVGKEPSITDYVVDYTSAHAESAAFNAKTNFIRVHVDSIASFKISTAGTAATTSNARLAANQTEFFGVTPGDKISLITNT